MKKTIRTTQSRPAAGFTMLEMLLVLAVLSLLAGIAWPLLTNAYDRYLLEREVEKVRATMAQAKVHAMETGETYQFRFEPGKRLYIVIPYRYYESEADGESNSAARFPVRVGRLPEGMRFEYKEEPKLEGIESVPEQYLDQLPNASDLRQASWSVPIIFHPEGEAEPGEFLVKDEKKRTITLSVRTLTGAIYVSKIVKASR